MNNACTHGREFVAMASDVRKRRLRFPDHRGMPHFVTEKGAPPPLTRRTIPYTHRKVPHGHVRRISPRYPY